MISNTENKPQPRGPLWGENSHRYQFFCLKQCNKPVIKKKEKKILKTLNGLGDLLFWVSWCPLLIVFLFMNYLLHFPRELMWSRGWCWPPLLSSRQGTAPWWRHNGRHGAWSDRLRSRWASPPRSPAACRCGCAGSGRGGPPAGRCARRWVAAHQAAGSMTVRSFPACTSCPSPSWGCFRR